MQVNPRNLTKRHIEQYRIRSGERIRRYLLSKEDIDYIIDRVQRGKHLVFVENFDDFYIEEESEDDIGLWFPYGDTILISKNSTNERVESEPMTK